MRRCLCAVVLWSAILLGAAPERAAAQLRCTPPTADLAEIRGGAPRQQRFTLVNTSAAPLDIVEVERGCGCLEAHLDRLLLPPGARATLLVELRTTGQPNGPRSWNLRVHYRSGAQTRQLLIVLGGTIRNEVTVEPSILALHVRTTLRQEITVIDRRPTPLKVTALHATSPAIRATVKSTEAGVTKLTLEVAAAALVKDREDAVLNIDTDDPVYSPLQLPITLTRVASAAVVATPAQVQAHVSVARPLAAALVRLRRADGKPAVVTTVTADDPGIACTWAAGPGAATTLKVQVDARRLSARNGVRSVQVRLGDERIVIPVLVERER